jgi:iron(III) transport system substrate-binding protein
MNRFTILIIFAFILAAPHQSIAQSVTLYTAGPDNLAKAIAKSFADKTSVKVDVYQATSGDVLARLEGEKAKPRADVVVLASWGEGLTVRRRNFVDSYTSGESKKLRPPMVRWRPCRPGRRRACADSQ